MSLSCNRCLEGRLKGILIPNELCVSRETDNSFRKLRETSKSMLDEPHLLSYIHMFKDALWANGQLKSGGAPHCRGGTTASTS